MRGGNMRPAICAIGILLLVLCIGVVSADTLTGYNYYQIHNITGNSTWGSDLQSYPIYFDVYNTSGTSTGSTVYLNNHSLNFPHDFTVTTSDGVTELETLLHNNWHNESYARVWVKTDTLSSTGDTEFYIYYGNSTASPAEGAYTQTMFPLYDDFNTYFPKTRYTISADASKYESWGAVANLSNGNLLGVYAKNINNVHTATVGKSIAIRNSTNNGATWGTEYTVVNITDWGSTNPGLVVFNNSGTETILVAAVRQNLTPTYDRAFVVKSTDGGVTWGSPIYAPNNTVRRDTYGNPIYLSNGKILFPTYDQENNSYVEESSDGGDTWTEYLVNTSATLLPGESSIIETKTDGSYTGGVYLTTRVENTNHYVYYSTSTDYGHTWTPLVNTSEPAYAPNLGGSPQGLTRRANGDILKTYSNGTVGYAYVSSDEGVSWTRQLIYDSEPSVDLASHYSRPIELNSTHYGVTWCTNDDTASDQYFTVVEYRPRANWTVSNSPTVSVTGGELDFTQNAATETLWSPPIGTYNYSIMWSARTNSLADNNGRAATGFGAYSWTVSTHFMGMIVYSTGSDTIDFGVENGTNRALAAQFTDDTSNHTEEVQRFSTKGDYYRDGSLKLTLTNTLPTTSLGAMIGSMYWSTPTIYHSIYDWVLVRDVRSPEPTHSDWGSEEAAAGGDSTPPPSISNLANTTTCNSINWTWTNPGGDQNETVIWKDNVLLHNVTNTTTYDLWETLISNTSYTFSSKTKDIAGNLNATFYNNTSTTRTKIVSDFTKTKTIVVFPSTITFDDTSTETPSGWSWDMGDGRTAVTIENPTYQYLNRGLFKVVLTANNEYSGCNDASDPQYVWVTGFPQFFMGASKSESLFVSLDTATFTSSRDLSEEETLRVLRNMYGV